MAFNAQLIVVVLLHLGLCYPFEILRPRGVSLEKAPLYNPDNNFTCFDGSNTIPFLWVNDDYCDCNDGTDEPGTAACQNMKFHCDNVGHRPMEIDSSRVNDGICDCCDGSDEWASETHCLNSCHELGLVERERILKMQEDSEAGYQIKLQMVEKAKEKHKEMQEELGRLQRSRDEAEAIRTEKEELRRVAEERKNEALEKYQEAEGEKQLDQEEEGEVPEKEKEKIQSQESSAEQTFAWLDSNGDGKVTLPELQSHSIFDQNRDGIVTDEEARFFLGNHDSNDLEHFKKTGYILMYPYLMKERGLFTPPSDGEPDVGEGEWSEGLPEEDEEEHSEKEEDLPEVEKKAPEYDEATQALIDAANMASREYDDADRAVRDIERDIRKLEDDVNTDYGPDSVFLALEKECIEFPESEYVYKLCLFDSSHQRRKDGTGDTALGNWNKWAGPHNDLYSFVSLSLSSPLLFVAEMHSLDGDDGIRQRGFVLERTAPLDQGHIEMRKGDETG
ncbi:unnamed protein product [Darwinula stevensoni]|uniref:Glucosidase 2 subunit beta n=1 Tax=Darwinula stevensoni TaxID=69355 RepID=A0A7R9A5D6_9CRUS|nr:unnamed protein product [Darwinula stevensoni]CAG0886261.1 unnamed protein product [Darwinula stevensoni]